MNASKVLHRMVKLIEEGRATEEQLGGMLEASRIQITLGSKVGTYREGMLCIDEALHSLDPEGISTVAMPEDWWEHKADIRATQAERVRAKARAEDEAVEKAEAEEESLDAAAEAKATPPAPKVIEVDVESQLPFDSSAQA